MKNNHVHYHSDMISCPLDLWAHSGLNSVDLKLCYDKLDATEFGFYLCDILGLRIEQVA